ncbi:MAG: 1-acyl-sn-glycerol-3-phosphate acyltransferase [Kineosporiaceae bacterium]|nr:1-acyl-sn-glycerol-3-phosphate acyltransferase [Kineosporiaceae bacterium]
MRTEAHGYLTEMLASHGDRATRSWNRFGAWMLRAHDVLVDEEELARLRSLDREHSLALIFSHRSYLDGWVLPLALAARRFSPTYTFGGANLDLPVLGRLASRTGIIFIRRATRDTPSTGWRCAATSPTWCGGRRTWPGPSRAAGPAPASCVRPFTASCATWSMRWSRVRRTRIRSAASPPRPSPR